MARLGAPASATPAPPSRWRAAGRLGLVALMVFATCGPSVFAEDDSPAAFFRADKELMQRMRQPKPIIRQRPTHLIRRAAPVRGFTREEPVHPARAPVPESLAAPEPDQQADGMPAAPPPDQPSLPPGPVPPPAQTADKPAQPKPGEPSFTIAVIGDSLGQMLGQGLAEAYADTPEVSILRRARENSGLVREDYFDWAKAARDLLSEKDKLDAVVMMIGSNDRQQIRDGNQTLDMRSDRWKQIYADRVTAIAQLFKEHKVPLIWVGMPVMKNERLSSDMVQLNEIFRERVSRAGGIFVDTWEAFLDDRGQFATYGPDVNGQFQKLRAGDGVHFTRSGARKLAHFVEVEIKRLMDDAKPAIDPAVAVVTTPPVPEAPAPSKGEGGRTPAGANPLAALPIPAAPAEVVIRVKPAAGPVVPLTGPALAPGGQLASARPRRASNGSGNEAQALIDRALVQGRPLDARPGRADDFTWPPRP